MKDILTETYWELFDDGVFFHTGNYQLDGKCDSVIVSDGEHYGIFLDIGKVQTPMQEKMAVTHEWAHYRTGSTYSINADETVRKQAERRADKAQIRRLVPKADLAAAVADGRTEPWELAEIFGVPESFMCQAIQYYQKEERRL